MSMEQLKEQVAHLAPKMQRELMAYMVALQTGRDNEFKQKLARKIDDANPAHWVDLDDLNRKLDE